METDYDALREALVAGPCYVIDFLPRQVPASGGGQYFAVEDYFARKKQLRKLYRRFAALLLKLTCYYAMVVGGEEEWTADLPPEEIAEQVVACAKGGYIHLLLPSERALIALDGGDLHMTVWSASKALLGDLKILARGEGIWLWQPGQEE